LELYFLEACVTTLDEAITAELNGAHRLEICTRLETGGMTPEVQLVKDILSKTSIPCRIMIREEAEGFEADNSTLNKMVDAIHQFENIPIDGFVFGLLKNNSVDREGMDVLLRHAAPYSVTFHKAIDLSVNKWDDIEWMNDQILIDTILTSGGFALATEGVDEILKMKNAFKKNIMAAGKIKPDQLTGLHEKLQLKWYHGRNIVPLTPNP